MTREKQLGLQVRHLLSNLSDHGAQHLNEVETDLAQTSFLLHEAIGKLSAGFLAIHAAVLEHQASVDILLSGAEVSAPHATLRLRAAQDEIARHVNAVVTGLQFQDMTNQLIGRSVQRVAGLRDVLGDVGAGSTGIQEDSIDDLVSALDNINRVLEERSVRLESTLWKSVSQTHMDSGEIELF